MKAFATVAVCAVFVGLVAVSVVRADDAAPKEAAEAAAAGAGDDDETTIKVYKRLIPADVLRDFPGMCFASTRCATIEPGKGWDLSPFCGRSTCVVGEDSRLLELVEDCGPLPLANDKCKLDTEKTNKSAPFPQCCPKFTCEPGVKLEYPEVRTDAPEQAPAAAATEKN